MKTNWEYRMEKSGCMRAFLLLVFISGVHLLSPGPLLRFGIKGGRAELGNFHAADHTLMYRIYEDGDLLLVNCSQPDSPQPDGYNITCPDFLQGFRLNNLTMSHSGDYRVERRGNSIGVRSTVYRLTICAEGDVTWYFFREAQIVYVTDGSAVLCECDSAVGNGSSLQLYEVDRYGRSTLLLDTSSSLEPLVPGMKGRLQVDTNASRVTLSGMMYIEHEKKFLCTMWRGDQCQHARPQQLVSGPPVIATHEKENVTIPCTFRGNSSEQVYWETPAGEVRISGNQTRPQEVMYMLSGSQSGDYSLIIPSVSRQHHGGFGCVHSSVPIHMIFLSVCVEFSPVTVMFSHGESVLMDARVNDSEILHRAQWFRQTTGLHPSQTPIIDAVDSKDLIYFGVNEVRVPEDLMGRVTVFNSGRSLSISNLTAEDSGVVYTWRVISDPPYGSDFFCNQGRIRLLDRDPLGVDDEVEEAED